MSRRIGTAISKDRFAIERVIDEDTVITSSRNRNKGDDYNLDNKQDGGYNEDSGYDYDGGYDYDSGYDASRYRQGSLNDI